MKEVLLPFLSIILPKSMKRFEEIKANLSHNENRMVTMYDLHASFISLVKHDYMYANNYERSIFMEKFQNGWPHTCEAHDINEERCRCDDMVGT